MSRNFAFKVDASTPELQSMMVAAKAQQEAARMQLKFLKAKAKKLGEDSKAFMLPVWKEVHRVAAERGAIPKGKAEGDINYSIDHKAGVVYWEPMNAAPASFQEFMRMMAGDAAGHQCGPECDDHD